MAIYVDELLVTGKMNKIKRSTAKFSTGFPCKDLGQAEYLLGLEINIMDAYTSISQAFYIQRMVHSVPTVSADQTAEYISFQKAKMWLCDVYISAHKHIPAFSY